MDDVSLVVIILQFVLPTTILSVLSWFNPQQLLLITTTQVSWINLTMVCCTIFSCHLLNLFLDPTNILLHGCNSVGDVTSRLFLLQLVDSLELFGQPVV